MTVSMSDETLIQAPSFPGRQSNTSRLPSGSNVRGVVSPHWRSTSLPFCLKFSRPFRFHLKYHYSNSIITFLTNYDILTIFTRKGEIGTMLPCGTLTSNSETDKVDKINSFVRDFIHRDWERKDRVLSSRILYLKDVKIHRCSLKIFLQYTGFVINHLYTRDPLGTSRIDEENSDWVI